MNINEENMIHTIEKLREIVPNEEQIKIMNKAASFYCSRMNKIRPYYSYLLVEDVLGNAYEGLLIAINRYYNSDKEYNISFENYATIRIRGHLIDCYRNEYGRQGKKKIQLNTEKAISINEINTTDISPDKDFSGILLSDVDVLEDIMTKDKYEYVYNLFKMYMYHSPNLFKVKKLAINIFPLYFEGYSLSYIGDKLNISESRISQIVLETIKPFVKIIRKDIQKLYQNLI